MEKVVAKMDMEAFRQLRKAEDEANLYRLIAYSLAGKLSTHESYAGITPEEIIESTRRQVNQKENNENG